MTSITIDLNRPARKGPCAISRDLLEDGHAPDTLVAFVRGSTPCFSPAPLSKWAGLTAEESSSGAHMRFRPYRER
ncbi:hypothetical protein RGUI_3385 [Rhodovulum sp. P5]|uniref:hypothetical protein n=1 Tax=Rhodovulum sp. P5 TaxID=1564506 RepID=UPI0009C28CC9|nr:hypothetical protein [Rhodovulum sp. P5]ARE39956.1 hypothetical protein RGUI_1815 [Rhodovulum sp. P5]ARE41526.1 hypothetical protein RGUI_3385 [Rhodovulum sp. P5]